MTQIDQKKYFSDLRLGEKTLKALQAVGYVHPTPIQEQIIPYVHEGRDVFGCAQTGTGKTASYTLPLLDALEKGRRRARMPRGLVLTPTRELALQVKESIETYGQFHDLRLAVLIGGEPMGRQETELTKSIDVVIATPGRLLDLFDRGKLLLTGIEFLVIDEADRMLDMGFIPDVEKIVSFIPRHPQTLFFSATIPKQIQKLSRDFLRDPIEISVTIQGTTAETVEQFKLWVSGPEKNKILQRILEQERIEKAIIFCNRKKDISALSTFLNRQGYKTETFHGDLPQSQRTKTLTAFKKGEVKFLVASDVAGRGLDIDELPCVFNYDVPFNAEEYVHRIGRTGRAGQKGLAYMLVTKQEQKNLAAIEKIIQKTIPELKIDLLDSKIKGDQTKESKEKKCSPPLAKEFEQKKRKQNTSKAELTSDPPSHIKVDLDSNQGFGREAPPAFFQLEWEGLTKNPEQNLSQELIGPSKAP